MASEKPLAMQEKAIVEYTPFGNDSKIKLSIAIIKELICVPTKSGKICSDKDAIKFMAMCQARKLNPFEGDAFLIGYDSEKYGPQYSLITAHQAFLKRAEVNPEYDGMESGVVVESDGKVKDIEGDFTTAGQKVVGGWARVHFKTRKHPMYKRIRLARFQKNFGVWLEDAAGMICKCAEADALRSSFPTMLGGLYLHEEGPRQSRVEIMEAKIEPVNGGEPQELSNGKEAATTRTEGPSSPRSSPLTAENPTVDAPTVASESAATASQEAAPPVRKRLRRIKTQPATEELTPTSSIGPNRAQILERLKVGNYTENQFLELCNKHGWLGHGRKWDSLDQVKDEMLEVFLSPDEWPTVQEGLEELPPHTIQI